MSAALAVADVDGGRRVLEALRPAVDQSRRPRSVVRAHDREPLLALLALHARPDPVILDATFGLGVMWKGLPVQPAYKVDINPDLHAAGLTTHVADFAALPFPDRSVDVIVFDPPHLTEAGKTSRMTRRYGLGDASVQGVADIAHLFPPFLAEAERLLRRPGGIILAKVADQVHRNKKRWHGYEFLKACFAAGLTPCDQIIKEPPAGGTIRGSTWKRVQHTRQVHCYWFVVRVGRRCYRPPIFEREAPSCSSPSSASGAC